MISIFIAAAAAATRCGFANDNFYTTTSAEGFVTNIWRDYSQWENVGVIDGMLVFLGKPASVSIDLMLPANAVQLNFAFNYTSYVVVGTSFSPSFKYSFAPSTRFLIGGGGDSELITSAGQRSATRTKSDGNGGVLTLTLGVTGSNDPLQQSADNYVKFDSVSVEILCDTTTIRTTTATALPATTTSARAPRTEPPATSCRQLYRSTALSCSAAPSGSSLACDMLAPWCQGRVQSIDERNYTSCRAPCTTCRTLLVAAACNACQGCRFVGNPATDPYPCVGTPNYQCNSYTSITSCQQSGCRWNSFFECALRNGYEQPQCDDLNMTQCASFPTVCYWGLTTRSTTQSWPTTGTTTKSVTTRSNSGESTTSRTDATFITDINVQQSTAVTTTTTMTTMMTTIVGATIFATIFCY